MKVFLALCILLIIPATGLAQNNSILGYYRLADSIASFPPLDKKPYVICQRELAGRFVTFIGFTGDHIARIVAVTLKPITDVQKEISLTVDFDSSRPTPGKITTWGYIYDRNGDGKVDYMALVGGAAAFEDEDFPPYFPPRGRPLNRKQIDYFVGQCRIIFNHFADDNYDGQVDAIIQADFDPLRDWVKQELLVRSSAFNGLFDDVRTFRKSIEQGIDTMKHTETSVPYHPVGNFNPAIDKKMFDEKSAIMNLINTAIGICNITPGQLAHPTAQ